MFESEELVDTHFHLYDFSKLKYDWPPPDHKVLYRDWPPQQYEQEKEGTPFKHCIFVQTINNSPEEVEFIFELSKKYDFIKGIVGGLDVTSSNIRDEIRRLRANAKLVGVRHILDFEDADWLARDDVIKGLCVLEEENMPFDLLLRPPLLKYVPSLAKKVPNLQMVVDHIGKPYVKDKVIDGWKEDMEEIAKCPNIHCKISGLVNEGNLDNWNFSDFEPYMQHIMKIFGPDRCMFGSDWPIFNIASATYPQIFELAKDMVKGSSQDDMRKIFRENAIKFYNLKI